jgi:hypothetical protein
MFSVHGKIYLMIHLPWPRRQTLPHASTISPVHSSLNPSEYSQAMLIPKCLLCIHIDISINAVYVAH